MKLETQCLSQSKAKEGFSKLEDGCEEVTNKSGQGDKNIES